MKKILAGIAIFALAGIMIPAMQQADAKHEFFSSCPKEFGSDPVPAQPEDEDKDKNNNGYVCVKTLNVLICKPGELCSHKKIVIDDHPGNLTPPTL